MLKNRVIFILSILIMVVPFTGFPSFWRDSFVIILGLATAVLSFMIMREVSQGIESAPKVSQTFAEKKPSENLIDNSNGQN